MPPDARSMVLKFVPNNPKIAKSTINVLNNVFGARFLPQELVKIIVRRAFELERDQQIEPESTIFAEKLSAYAQQIKPRFMKKIVDGNRRTKKW